MSRWTAATVAATTAAGVTACRFGARECWQRRHNTAFKKQSQMMVHNGRCSSLPQAFVIGKQHRHGARRGSRPRWRDCHAEPHKPAGRRGDVGALEEEVLHRLVGAGSRARGGRGTHVGRRTPQVDPSEEHTRVQRHVEDRRPRASKCECGEGGSMGHS